MSNESSLEEGIDKAITLIEQISKRPILVAVYGWPHSGKSYLIDRLTEYFIQQGKRVAGYSGAVRAGFFEDFLQADAILRDLYLFHCGWERGNDNTEWLASRAHEDPNVLVKKILNKKIHINIGIYNPKLYSKPKGDYDLVIRNPLARNDTHSRF